jgi:hypothetical protein
VAGVRRQQQRQQPRDLAVGGDELAQQPRQRDGLGGEVGPLEVWA